MASYGDEIARQFLRAYSDDFLQDGIRLLHTAYRGSHEECRSSHAAPEAHDLYPHVRRARIEGQLRGLARMHGITASAERNHAGTSNYTLLTSGNVLLTANAVDHPNVIVRRAVFRETFARASQLKLFGDEEVPEQPSKGPLLYAILLHGPDVLNRAVPEFAHIVFPDETCQQYAARINLFDRFRTLVDELRGVEEEVVADNLDVRIRPDAGEKNRNEQGTEGS